MTAATFKESLFAALRTSCMIAFIIAGASFLSSAMSFTQIPMQFAEGIATLGLSPTMLLVVLTLFLLVLGCFLDGISLILLVTSIIMPVIEAAGFDLIWFGIYLIIVVEMSQITPPVPIPVKLETEKGKAPARAGMKATESHNTGLLRRNL